MFDRVWVTCSYCGEQREFQSKAGECMMNDYDLTALPTEVAADLIGDFTVCECGQRIRLNGFVSLWDEQI